MLSNPHMYLADTKYTSLIEGQVPDPAVDITRIDVEPNTGNGTLAHIRAHLTCSNEKVSHPLTLLLLLLLALCSGVVRRVGADQYLFGPVEDLLPDDHL